MGTIVFLESLRMGMAKEVLWFNLYNQLENDSKGKEVRFKIED